MRLLSVALLTALFVPLAAFAQPVRQVEVTNLPAVQEVTGAVEVTNDTANPVEVAGEVAVTNLPTPTAAVRYQLVGFTAAVFLGDTGVLGFTAACQSEFSNADVRMCTSEEVMTTTTIPSELSGQAWVRPVVVAGGDATSFAGCFVIGRISQPAIVSRLASHRCLRIDGLREWDIHHQRLFSRAARILLRPRVVAPTLPAAPHRLVRLWWDFSQEATLGRLGHPVSM